MTLSGMDAISRPTPIQKRASGEGRWSRAGGVGEASLPKRRCTAASREGGIGSQKQHGLGAQPGIGASVEPGMTVQTHTAAVPMDLFRPYLIVACVAFVLGFAAFLAVGWAAAPREATAEPWPAPASAPAPAADLAGAHVA